MSALPSPETRVDAVAPAAPRWLDEVRARWLEVLDDASLRNLPYKIETNRGGQLVMSPAKNAHGALQMRIGRLLESGLGSRTIAECSVATREGVKVADVAWGSASFFREHGFADPYVVAPEICVEIKSPSNAEVELQMKVRLYLDASAREVWLVDAKGGVRIYGPDGLLPASTFGVDTSAVAYVEGDR